MQSQEDVFRCIEGLTLYAAERDICMESGDTDARIRRIRRLISGMSELYGLPELPEVYDKRISAARGCSASEIAGISQQKDAVWGLVCYAKDLAPGPDDSRSMMLEIQKLFDEMYAYLPWNPWGSGPNGARDVLALLLRTATAQQNIVFTRVLLGGDRDPSASDFVSGAVTDARSVSNTQLFAELTREHPEMNRWPCLCTVWRGGYGRGNPVPATDLDLEIIRQSGDRFLKSEGVICCGPEHQITIETEPQIEAGPRMKL